MSLLNTIYSGTSGLVLPVNKANFPEAFKDKSRLEYYGALFNSIEINSTFYKLPKIITVEKWAASVQADFRFTFKMPKAITHAPNFEFHLQDLLQFLETVDGVGAKKGCLLAQFPPSFKISHLEFLKQLLDFCFQYNPAAGWKLAIEFRDKSWYCSQVYDLLANYGAILVYHDKLNCEIPLGPNQSQGVYWRFHGPSANYRGSYSDSFLQQKAIHLKDFLNNGNSAFVYFNNTMGDAIGNLNSFNNYINS